MTGSLPIGGTTGLSHEHTAAVETAAEWLKSLPRHHLPHPIIPELQKLFGLTVLEAVEAIHEASNNQ